MVFVLLEKQFERGKANGQNPCWLHCRAAEVVVLDLVPFDAWGRYESLDLLKTPN